MSVRIDRSLSQRQFTEMVQIPAEHWFTSFEFANAKSPSHPNVRLNENNEMKAKIVIDWIQQYVKGKRVLDLFCANGGFSALAAMSGAEEVVGLDYSQERLRCAEFVGGTLGEQYNIRFLRGDIYQLDKIISESFDVTLCLGGLYHIADPAYILRKIRERTMGRLILQTSQVLASRRNLAKFVVRDKTVSSMTSINAGYGTWHCSPESLRRLIRHGGFAIVEERRPPWLKRKRFPWYFANCVVD